ncbi:MAG: cupin domain-containing protein [Rhodospirillales bacterium]|nr:MAG: cupin domain-containing protein [Rhodospirillales bacterium]
MTSHPAPAEMLLDYATGALPEGPALVVACHLSLAPESLELVADLEAVGGAMLAATPAAPMDDGALAAVLARLDDADEAAAPDAAPGPLAGLPPAVRAYVPEGAAWSRVMPGVEEIALPLRDGRHNAALMRIGAGRAIPRHTHEGVEYTLVISGAFNDGERRYAAGDICVADASLDHRPAVDGVEACVCLAVSEASIVLTGPVGRWLNPLLRRRSAKPPR